MDRMDRMGRMEWEMGEVAAVWCVGCDWWSKNLQTSSKKDLFLLLVVQRLDHQ